MIKRPINNRHQVTTRLGNGTMGKVYRATDTQACQRMNERMADEVHSFAYAKRLPIRWQIFTHGDL